MKKIKLFIIILAVFSIGFSNSYAQISRDRLEDKNYGRKHLNLSESQKENFNNTRFENEKARIELQAELKTNTLMIKKLLNENNFDEKKLLALVETGNNIKSKLKNANVEMWLKIRNILDEDQKKFWTKHFNKMDRITEMDFTWNKRNKLRDCWKNYHKKNE